MQTKIYKNSDICHAKLQNNIYIPQAIRQENSVGLLFFCILECKHYEHYDGHEITQRAAGAEVPRGCGRAGNHEALRYDADGGTYWYLWLILTNCVKGWERLTYNRLRSCKRTFKSAE